ncbi:MAG: hypothetical protein QE271_07430 [Bacteriovoracaceae bacterium]|nr:hypothetical protein [Bacteriovoracaceae bacterium]
MQNIYGPCPCGSGKKLKFCCHQKLAAIDPASLLKQAASFRVHECWIMEDWEDGGLAPILVVRQQPNFKYQFGLYLVDYYCLGVKSTICDVNVAYGKIEEIQSRTPYAWLEFDYQDARGLILGSIEYARGLGFAPDVGWENSKHLVEANTPFDNKFTFGMDGKPLFINGPDDDVASIMKTLQGKDIGYTIGGQEIMF